MKKIITIFPLLVLLAMAACTGNSTFERQLAVADSLMRHNYDSAYTMLKDMDSMAQHMPERLRMKHLLLRANAQNKAWEFFTSDSTGKTLTKYYDRKGTPNERMLAHYIKGCAYRDMGDAMRALDCYRKAIEMADTTEKHCDMQTLMRIHSQMSEVYNKQRLYNEAEKHNSIAEKLCWKTGDTLSAMIFREYAINRMFRDGKFDECIKRAKDLKEVYFKRGQKDKGYLICILIAKSYLKLKEYDMAEKYIALYEKCSYLKGDLKKISGRDVPLYILKGKLYLMKGLLDSAEFYLKKTYPNYLSHKNELAAYSALCNLYERNNQRDSLYKYSILYTQAKEKSFNESNTQNIILAQSLYDYSVEQREAKEQKEKAEQRKNWIYALSFVTFVCIVISLSIQQQKKEKELEIKSLLLRLTNTLTELRINREETERLMQEKTNTEAFWEQEREVREDYARKLKLVEEDVKKKNMHGQILQQQVLYLEQKLKEKKERKDVEHSSVIQYFKKVRLNPKQYPVTEEDWKQMRNTIEEGFPTFFLRTHSGKRISEKEYKLCLLVKAGFSPTDINVILDSKEYATNTRKRLLKKIFNIDGTPKDFDQMIQSLV